VIERERQLGHTIELARRLCKLHESQLCKDLKSGHAQLKKNSILLAREAARERGTRLDLTQRHSREKWACRLPYLKPDGEIKQPPSSPTVCWRLAANLALTSPNWPGDSEALRHRYCARCSPIASAGWFTRPGRRGWNCPPILRWTDAPMPGRGPCARFLDMAIPRLRSRLSS